MDVIALVGPSGTGKSHRALLVAHKHQADAIIDDGILIKDAQALELAHRVNTVAFDKTGTLTLGKPQLTELVSLNGQPEAELLALAIQNNIVGACLERGGGKQGREDALLMLRHMVTGGELTPLGRLMLDEMNTLFCAEVREMIDRGDDPGIVLAQEREQRLGAAQ